METINNLNTFSDLIETDPSTQPLMDIVTSIMDIPDDSLTKDTIEMITGMINGAITPNLRKQMVDSLTNSFREIGASRGETKQKIESSRLAMIDFVNELKPSAQKKVLLDSIFAVFYETFDEVEKRYLAYDIELPIVLEGDAQVPTYAHDTDAAADLYARETIVVPAHSFSNKIDTGVHIGLPEGWVAHIAPRSSIGAKTPLRLSNMLGVIDAGYRGPLIVMFDNLSDFDYTINAGDRIAQLWVTPSYRFKALVVDTLDETERNSGGLGSTGK